MSTASIPLALGLGLALGIRHAVDPDHLAAVLALSQSEKSSGRVVVSALAWGLGHSLTFLCCGFAVVAFGFAPPAGFEDAVTLAVATSLIGVGAIAIRRVVHPTPLADGALPECSSRLRRRAFAVGGVHGLAGSHAVALLALASLREPEVAAAHLVIFCLGTLLGMAGIALLIGRSLEGSAKYGPRLCGVIGILAGASSVMLGLVLVGELII